MEELKVKSEKIRKVFLDDLPRKKGTGLSIDWINSVGYKVNGNYEGLEFEVEIIGYDKNYLTIKYLDKEPFKIHVGNFTMCKFGKLLNKYTNEFKVEIGTIFKDNKRDLVIIQKKIKTKNDKQGWRINEKYYQYKCNKCGYVDWVIERSLLNQKTGCPVCCTIPQTISIGINDIPTTAPWMVKYFQGGYDEAKKYTKGSDLSIIPICPDCGRVKDKEMNIKDIYRRKSIGCSCGDGMSYPEKFMFNLLEQLNINYTHQYSPDWIKPKRYDFYFKLDDKEYIVETDGGLGHGKKSHSKSNKTKEETKLDDDYKDMMADQHGIKVIRIDCEKSELEYIKEKILDSKLGGLFNLNIINWLQCEEFALSNLVKKVCEIKRDNPEMTTVDISRIMNLTQPTIIKYLKQGTTLDWCNYDAKLEKSKSSSRAGKTNGKNVEIFKDGLSLGIFESATELERQSEETFGVKLLQGNISSVCRNMYKQYKGFTFKYVS